MWTCTYAALNGHLEALDWARDNGCKWDKLTCVYAAKNGHLEVLKWLRENGCDWDSSICLYVASNGPIFRKVPIKLEIMVAIGIVIHVVLPL